MIDHAVIVATGSPGHRSRLVHNRAHAMLPAVGKPIIVQTMNRFYRLGIRTFTVIIGEKEGGVAAYLTEQWVPDARLNMVLKSTTDSLLSLLQTIVRDNPTPVIVSSYNSFTHHRFPERLIRQHQENPSAMTIAGAASTLSQDHRSSYACFDEQRIVDISATRHESGKSLTLTDSYVYGNNTISYLLDLPKEALKAGFYWHLMDIAKHHLQTGGELRAAESAWLLQVETDDDLLILNRHLLNEGSDAHILSELPYTVNIIPPVRIDPQVNIGQGATVGPHVYIERGCSVGHNARLSNCMILNRVTIPADAEIKQQIISTTATGIT